MKARLIRPPNHARLVLRWTGRRWIDDDGKPGLAFSGRDDGGAPMAWVHEPAWDAEWGTAARSLCDRAMDETFKRFGCANGRGCRASREVQP